MRRSHLALALSLLLAFVQQGAVLHGLSHVYYSGRVPGARVSDDGHLIDDSLCLACQAFAQVTSPVSGSVAGLATPRPAYLHPPDHPYYIVSADAPTPRSRGPPHARV